MDCQFQTVISQVHFGGISGAPGKDSEKSRTQEPVPREYQISRDRRQWRYAKHTLNIQEFQLHFLYTMENERKTQGRGEFIFDTACTQTLYFQENIFTFENFHQESLPLPHFLLNPLPTIVLLKGLCYSYTPQGAVCFEKMCRWQ